MRKTWIAGAIGIAALARATLAGEIVDAAGRTIKVTEPVNRIVAAGPPAEVLLYAFAPDAMVGWMRPVPPRIAEYILPQYRSLPAVGTITAMGDTPEVSDIMKAKPQLFLDYGDVEKRYIEIADATQKKTGVPYALLDGALDKAPENLRALGKLTGRAARGEELAKYAEEILARAQKIAAAHAAKPTTVYVARSPDGTDTALPLTHAGDVYDLAGVKNIATQRGNIPGQIAALDPDMIIAHDAKFREDAAGNAWGSLRAVKGAHVIVTPRVPWGANDHPPSVQRLFGLLWLTSAVYGAPTTDELKSEARKFYKVFFRIDLTPEQVDALTAK